MKTGSGWVASYDPTGANPFATVRMSISGRSFHAHSDYLGGNAGYTANASGTFSSNCTIGVTSPPGHWSSNHDAAGGSFQMVPFTTARKRCSNGTAPPCPLNVAVKIFGRPRAGLAVFRHFAADGSGRVGSRVFFIPPGSEKCASGCMNVVVTVTNSKGQAVPDALVSIHASAVTGVTGGDGYLCLQFSAGSSETCGSRLDRLATDKDGQVRLRYWSPGLLGDATVTFNGITATKGGNKGSATPVSTSIRPYVIYRDSATLTEEQAGEFADFADPQGVKAALGKLITNAALTARLATVATHALIEAERFAEEAEKVLAGVEAVEPIVGVLELGVNALPEVLDRQGLIATFFDSLHLSAIGLGGDPVEPYVRAAPFTALENALANLGTIGPGKIGADGLLWRYAKALATLAEDRHPSFSAQRISIDVYEVSYCKQGQHCGPGYRDFAGGGIVPELYLHFESRSLQTGRPTFADQFIIGYDPNAWAETQAGVLEQIS